MNDIVASTDWNAPTGSSEYRKLAVHVDDNIRAANRSRYTGDAQTRCEETELKLAIVAAQIRVVGIAGSPAAHRHLLKAELQAETHLATVRRRLERLKHADDQSWPKHKQRLEDGCEDLLRSIKNIVTKLSSM